MRREGIRYSTFCPWVQAERDAGPLAHAGQKRRGAPETPLTAHLRHSHTRFDTNSVENAIRPSKRGAKNWLFIGHPDAGDRAAVLYSLIVSVQRRSLDPHAFLKDVLTRLPAMTTKDDLTPLLPTHWQPA